MTDLTVTLNKTIHASIGKVFDAWLDPDMLSRFILPAPGMPNPEVVRAFPDNTELEAFLTFKSSSPGVQVRRVAADPEAVFGGLGLATAAYNGFLPADPQWKDSWDVEFDLPAAKGVARPRIRPPQTTRHTVSVFGEEISADEPILRVGSTILRERI